MTMPASLRPFWEQMEALGEAVDRHPWGIVASDSRFPALPAANQATVVHWPPGLRLPAVRAPLLPRLQRSGAAREHILLLDWPAGQGSGSVEEGAGLRRSASVVYEFCGPAPAAVPPGVEVVEVAPGGRRRLTGFLGEARRLLGGGDAEVEQAERREQEVLVPAGLRRFVGMVDGQPAGSTTLQSFDGVGFIDDLVVLPVHRGLGVGCAVLCAALQASHEAGDRVVHAFSRGDNPARSLYDRLGCRTSGAVRSLSRRLPTVTYLR